MITTDLRVTLSSPHKELPIDPKKLVQVVAEAIRTTLIETGHYDDHYPNVDVYEPASQRGISVG